MGKQIIDGVDVVCEYCGKSFKKRKFEYKRTAHNFCSIECYHQYRIKKNNIIIHSDYAEIVIDDKFVLIDLEDVYFCKKYHWRISNKGYVTTTINKKTFSLHRLLKKPKENEVIDHINQNKLDNRKSNLKICSQLINMQNRGINKNNKTGVCGISLNKKNKYVVSCQINKNRKYLGTFKTLNDAEENLKKYKEENKIG